MDKAKVFVCPPRQGVDDLFHGYGWELVSIDDIDKADAIVLTGGADIHPFLYGQQPNPRAHLWLNQIRDEREVALVDLYRGKKPMIGICRGAQLLNVLAGGAMWQHVNNHEGGYHRVFDHKNRNYTSNTVHHQMMITPPGGKLLAWAERCTLKIGKEGQEIVRTDEHWLSKDPEVVYFDDLKWLAFQAHPEYGHKETTEAFFQYVRECL